MPSSSMGNYYATREIEFLLRGTPFTRPTNGIWVAMFTTLPQLDGTGGVEVSASGTGYARVQIPDNGWTGPSGSSLAYSNTNPLTFPLPTGNWGTVVGNCLMDAQTGGNLIYVCYASSPRTINGGDGQPLIQSGGLVLSRASC